jgi:peptide deformylase
VAVATARVRIYGASCLRRRAEPADPAATATATLLDRLWHALETDGGVGLAAPQIGRAVRVFVVRDPGRPAGRQRLELINPELVETFGPREPFEEGCLSFPGLYTTVWRPRGAVVRYQTRGGEHTELRDEGLLARIIQHEIDHLDGVLFIDHLSGWRRFLLAPRLLWMRLLRRRQDKGE